MAEERRYKSISAILDEVRRQGEAGASGSPLLDERLLRRFGVALGAVASIPFMILDGQTRGSGGQIKLPKPNVFDLPDMVAVGGGGEVSSFPDPGPSTPPTPPPPPSGGSAVPNNALDIVIAVRAGYPTPMRGSTLLSFLRETARALGPDAGLLAKDWGNNVGGYSTDTIVFTNGDTYDVLINSEWSAKPDWRYSGHVDPSRWRKP